MILLRKVIGMKKILRIVWSVLEFVIILFVILMTSVLLSKNKYGYTQFGKYTISSVDLVSERGIKDAKDGDLLIVKNSNDIKVGDVIYYYVVYNESYVIQSDPVINVESDDFSSAYTIDRGGNMTIASSRVLGKERKIYHGLGRILAVLESKLGFLFLVLLPVLVIFIYQVYELIIIFRYEKVEDGESSEKETSKTE
jgi:energy-coupling factor transporter transmembrane protein EcfT